MILTVILNFYWRFTEIFVPSNCIIKMPGSRISPTTHAQIKCLNENGLSSREIASKLKLVQSTVVRSLKMQRKTNNFEYKKPSGRPRCTSKTLDDSIILAAKKSPRKSSEAIRVNLPEARPSSVTIRRRLIEAGLKSYRPAVKPALSKKNIADRLKFCHKYKNWTVNQWRSVMFSDESTVSQFYAFTRQVRRPPNQRYNERYVVPTVKNAPKVMIWGAISANGRCGLWFMPEGTTINGPVYLGILQEKLLNFMNITQCDTFQQDGAPCHQTKAVKKWLEESHIKLLGPWPGNSPDLNPIENCWMLVKKKVSEMNPTSISSLKEAIKTVWVKEISNEYCEKLIYSMPDRIQSVLKNKGKHTKY